MKIVVASGKGGTGKTMVAANLGYVLSRDHDVALVDCDVEEPNLHLFFPVKTSGTAVTAENPVFDLDLCTRCGACGKFCRYGAITVLRDRILFFSELCHSCGGCRIVCPEGAVTEKDRPIGRVETARPLPRLSLFSGVLNEGEVQAPRVVQAARAAAEGCPLVIQDAAPGVACAVMETMEGCDLCILVTESTPSGLHDLALALEAVEMLSIPAGVVINRSDGKDEAATAFCREHDLPILMTIPFDRRIAAVQNRGGLIARDLSGFDDRFATLYLNAMSLCGVNE